MGPVDVPINNSHLSISAARFKKEPSLAKIYTLLLLTSLLIFSALSLSWIEEEITILYVEDDTETAKHVSETLLLFSKNILIASNTEEAYEFFINNDIHLLITDIEMPGTDGYQVASFIKNHKNLSHIPVIVNSSMTTDAVRGKMSQVGVDGFVGKTDISNLFKLTKKFLLR